MSPRETLTTSSAASLPQYLLDALVQQPANVDRRAGAELVTRYFFPVSWRTLEAWALPVRRCNGKAIMPTAALFEMAYEKLSQAPLIMSGRRKVTRDTGDIHEQQAA